jgi:TRAP-type mannitol/chloroaromatic compound transport system permease large subunit
MTVAIFTFSLLGAMALGMPIAFALIVCGIALMHALDIFDSQIVAQNIINGADSFPLMAVPFFMLAGEIMNKGGLAKRIVNVALTMVGHVRGGLGYVTILASCALASLSGSAAADAAALASLLVPMMVAAGHDKKNAAASSRPSFRPASASSSSAWPAACRSRNCSWRASCPASCWGSDCALPGGGWRATRT